MSLTLQLRCRGTHLVEVGPNLPLALMACRSAASPKRHSCLPQPQPQQVGRAISHTRVERAERVTKCPQSTPDLVSPLCK